MIHFVILLIINEYLSQQNGRDKCIKINYDGCYTCLKDRLTAVGVAVIFIFHHSDKHNFVP